MIIVIWKTLNLDKKVKWWGRIQNVLIMVVYIYAVDNKGFSFVSVFLKGYLVSSAISQCTQ